MSKEIGYKSEESDDFPDLPLPDLPLDILLEMLVNDAIVEGKIEAMQKILTDATSPKISSTTRGKIAVKMSNLIFNENFYPQFLANKTTLLLAMLKLASTPDTNDYVKELVMIIMAILSRDGLLDTAEVAALLPDMLTMMTTIDVSDDIDGTKRFIAETIFRLSAPLALLAMLVAHDTSDSIKQGIAVIIINLSDNQDFCNQFFENKDAICVLLKMFAAENVSEFIKQNITITIKNFSLSEKFCTQFAENAEELLPVLLTIANIYSEGAGRHYEKPDISFVIMKLSSYQNFCTQFAENAEALPTLLRILIASNINYEVSIQQREYISIAILNLLRIEKKFCGILSANRDVLPTILIMAGAPNATELTQLNVSLAILRLGAMPNLLEMLTVSNVSDAARKGTITAIASLCSYFDFRNQFFANLEGQQVMLAAASDDSTSDVVREMIAEAISNLSHNADFCHQFTINREVLLPALLAIVSVPNAGDKTKQLIAIAIRNLKVSLPDLLAIFNHDTNNSTRQSVVIVSALSGLLRHNDFCNQFSANEDSLQILLEMFAAENVSELIKQNIATAISNLSLSQNFRDRFTKDKAALILPTLLAMTDTVSVRILTTIRDLSCHSNFCSQFTANATALPILLKVLKKVLKSPKKYSENEEDSKKAEQWAVLATTIANLLQNQVFRARFLSNTKVLPIILRKIAVSGYDPVVSINFARIITSIPILEFTNVLVTSQLPIEIIGGISKHLEALGLFRHKLVCKAEGVKNVAYRLKTAYTNSQISTRYLARLILDFLMEDLDKRIVNSAQFTAEELMSAKIDEAKRLAAELNDTNTLSAILAPENLPWAEALSEQYLRHCVNNRVWGVVTLFCVAEIANAPTIQAKRDAALDLMLLSAVKMQAIEYVNKQAAARKEAAQQKVNAALTEYKSLLAQRTKEETQGALNEEEHLKVQELEKKLLLAKGRLDGALREAQHNTRGPVNVEVELANLLLVRVLLKLERKLPGSPGQIAYEGSVIHSVTDELVENTCTVIRGQVFAATSQDVARFLCNAENSQAWAAIAFPDVESQCRDKGKKTAEFVGAIMEKRMEDKAKEGSDPKNFEPSPASQELSPDDQKLFEQLSILSDEDLACASTEERIYAEISESVYQLTLAAFASLDSQARPAPDVRVVEVSGCEDESVRHC